MDLILRQDAAKTLADYQAYRRCMQLCHDAVVARMRAGEDFCVFRVPRRLDLAPPFDSAEIAGLVARTLEGRYQFRASPFMENDDAFVLVAWTDVRLFREKRKVYERIFRKCDQSIRAYIESDVYKIGKRRSFYYSVNKTHDPEPFDPYVAARFLAAALRKQGFKADAVRASDAEAGVFATW